MKILVLVLSTFIIFGCSSSDSQLMEGNRIIQLKCTIGHDTLDTFNNTFTRNYYEKASYTINFSFTLDEQKRIISEINKVNFFDLPDELPHIGPMFYPSKYQFCEILLNDRSKKIIWVSISGYEDSDENKRLNSVMNIVREIVKGRKEVKELPEEAWY